MKIIKYDINGTIVGKMEIPNDSDLDLQTNNQLALGFHLLKIDQKHKIWDSFPEHINKFKIINNKIVNKSKITFLVNKPTFIANDIDSCVITAQNLTKPVNILIDRQPYIISPIDNIITITSNEPKIFIIEPDPQSIYYFDKIEIEAI